MNDNKSDDFLDDSSRSYVAQFRVHQEFVQAHLKGTLNDEQPLLPAFFPPSSYWTSHEKDLFFHGLAVYSRFRPDLIAGSIKTKSTLDVCLYLDILQSASSSIPSEIHGSFRSSLKPAMEVSDRWIQNEEQIAEALIQFDFCKWTPRSEDEETNKPEHRCVCSPKNLRLVDDTRSSSVDHSSQTELKKSYLSHLDRTCLMALEKIVHEAQLGEVDSMAISLSPTPDSFRPPATQICSPIEDALSPFSADLDSPESQPLASCIVTTPRGRDYSKLKAQYRFKKRIYMRRKRAQSAGRSIDVEAVRLRPGRQTTDRKPSRPRPKMYKKKRKIVLFNSGRKEGSEKPETIADPEANHAVSVPTPVDEMGQEDEAQHEPRSKGGLNKLHRTRNRFLGIGIDSQLASNNNLDFFHLSSLAQLMRLYSSVEDSTRPLIEVSITADTIHLLVAILREFISNVVRGLLISKEQEIRLKGALKVWKYDQEEITVENVRETLKSMGIAHSKEDYFAELIGEGNDDISSPDPSIGTKIKTKDDDNDGGRGGTDNQGSHECEIPKEDTVTNLSDAPDASEQSTEPSDASEQSAELSQALTEFWLPESFRRCLLPKHTRVSGDDDDILPEIKETELQRELKEDEELDARDLSASKDFETGLWGL
ncbi:hypothetical protein BYT27DRAFT_7143352 [Phlegmacium glaucopus]|nr:hypothetical protein BYT27DRAFT_7143352 [Phlegmacium glaucopus]